MVAPSAGATTSFAAPQRSQARAGWPLSRPRRASQFVQRKLTVGTRSFAAPKRRPTAAVRSFAVFAAQDDTTPLRGFVSLGALDVPIIGRVDDDLLAFADERRHEHGHPVLQRRRLVRRRGG